MRDEAKWQAVRTREAKHDRAFVYGVAGSAVYCRPSCPARRPRRGQVRYFDTPADAAAAGLHPCRRCRPLERWCDDPEVARVLDACRRIESAEPLPSAAALADALGLDAFRLNRLFHRLLGLTPGAYIEGERLRRVKRALRASASVTDAIYDAGLGSSRALYERAPAALGMTPRQYRHGGAGLVISHACGDSALGMVCIGATDRGLCFVQFGDDADALVAQLAREFPAARLEPMPDTARGAFHAWMRALAAHLEGERAAPQLPLDLQGSAFQLRVWNYLRSIPRGEVVSYAEAARALGAPKAARAVASACARNRVAVLVPCHRVVRGDGGLGGYRWGLPRKRALIDAERRARAATGDGARAS